MALSRYREELIQVAAVAVAMIEDHDSGNGAHGDYSDIMLDVAVERERQNIVWGPQHHDPSVWLAILMEEVGESAQAYLQETYE